MSGFKWWVLTPAHPQAIGPLPWLVHAKASVSCWFNSCNLSRIWSVRFRKSDTDYTVTLPLISILSFLNARAGETSEISIYFLSPLKRTHINSAAIPFLLNPLSLSFHPVHPGKHRGSEGWINKGVKVEHNSLRSAFSGTLTQRNTQAHMRLHKAQWQTHTGTHKCTCMLLMNDCDGEMGQGDAGRKRSIHPIICMLLL